MIKVLVVEEQELVKQGLVRLLNDASGLDIIGAVTRSDDAINIARSSKPNVVLLDLKMLLLAKFYMGMGDCANLIE